MAKGSGGALIQRHRFDRTGRVVADRRQLSDAYGTDTYRTGMLIFAPRRSSPARTAFKTARAAARRLAS